MGTPEPADNPTHRVSEDSSRIVALTDGVIAIAITLLVLDIVVPEIPDAMVDEELGDALWDLRPQVFGFVLSFAVIGYYWLGHRMVFSQLRRIDMPLILINLFFLLVIVFIPFAAGLLAEYVPNGLAVACYSAVMASCGEMSPYWVEAIPISPAVTMVEIRWRSSGNGRRSSSDSGSSAAGTTRT